MLLTANAGIGVGFVGKVIPVEGLRSEGCKCTGGSDCGGLREDEVGRSSEC